MAAKMQEDKIVCLDQAGDPLEFGDNRRVGWWPVGRGQLRSNLVTLPNAVRKNSDFFASNASSLQDLPHQRDIIGRSV
jgi:hypothetical protein